MKINLIFTVIILIAILQVESGCSSTGYTTISDISIPKTIKSPRSIPPELVPYVPSFVAALERSGFQVGSTDDPNAIELVVEFNGNLFNMRVSVGLWREGIPILTASATNPGWGTLLARGAAVNSLAESALKKFEIELRAFKSRTTILQDNQIDG